MAPSETVKPNENKQRAYLGNTQQNNPLSNPCIKEQDLSLQCLDRHNDKDACEIYFANYKSCRAFWNRVMKERRAAGIMPYLPLPEDRAAIKAEIYDSKR